MINKIRCLYTVVYFTNKKSSNLNISTKSFARNFRTTKVAHKMLVKLTLGEDVQKIEFDQQKIVQGQV